MEYLKRYIMEELIEFLKKVDEKIDVNRQLSYGFFIVFSRFEYALKNRKYLIANKQQVNRKAESDWDSFARANEKNFNPDQNKELKEAVEYISNNPPKKQVVDVNESLNWIDSAPITDYNGRKLEWLLLMIRRIRNNLFHGGKYPNFMVAEPSRNHKLIYSAIIILNNAVQLEPALSNEFFEPI